MMKKKKTKRFKGPGSLRMRLSLLVVLVVLIGVGIGQAMDYKRERRVHRERLLASLEEQGRALLVARKRIRGEAEYARYVDEFCAQMNEHVSPGHHILVLNPQGDVVIRARHHSGEKVEKALLSSRGEEKILSIPGHRLAQIRVKDDHGTTIILAQYLDHLDGILKTQLISRTLTAALVALAIVGLIFLAINRWVLKPVENLAVAARAWSRRDFSARSEVSGPSDLSLLAVEFNNMAAKHENYEYQRLLELERARKIQKHLLPTKIPRVKGLNIQAKYRPAGLVAGDLYDVFMLPSGKTAVTILDVSGHGIGAALLTGVVKMSLHWRLGEEENLAKAISHVNNDILNCMSDSDEQFVTIIVGIWNPQDSSWTYCAAGHAGGLLQTGQQVCNLSATGPLLGVFVGAQWVDKEIKMAKGDRLFLYSDGVTDAGAAEVALGTEGLENIIRDSVDLPLDQQVARVMHKAQERNAGVALDDITIVGLEVLSGDNSLS